MRNKNTKRYSTGLEVLKKEVKIDFFKSSGPGGQRKNKKETAVRIHHIPSGLIIESGRERSQSRNKETAFLQLQKKLRIFNRPKSKRIPTGVPLYSKRERLLDKKIHSRIKNFRIKPELE